MQGLQIGGIHNVVNGRPNYIVKDKIGFDEEESDRQQDSFTRVRGVR